MTGVAGERTGAFRRGADGLRESLWRRKGFAHDRATA